MESGTPGGAAARILIVDDEPAVRESLGSSLEFEGYRVATAHVALIDLLQASARQRGHVRLLDGHQADVARFGHQQPAQADREVLHGCVRAGDVGEVGRQPGPVEHLQSSSSGKSTRGSI
nr:response regulator [Spirillospora albida]